MPGDPEKQAWERHDRRAPSWQVRCLKCGFKDHWGKYGIRLRAAGRAYTLGRCSRCRRIRCHVIEKVPLELLRPSASFREEFIEYCEEFKSAGEPYAFGELPEAVADFPALVRKWEDAERGVNLPEGYVPGSVRWLTRGRRILGTARLRHRLNDNLTHEGGHIGYEVRPSERRKGYATRLLSMMLDEARAIGLKRVLVTCDKDNIPSAKTIQKNGGILENEVVSKRTGKVVQRYWIEL